MRCFKCVHKESIPGNTHISYKKPDPEMTGAYRDKSRWFFYPFNFDPVWIAKECSNFEPKEEGNV